MLKNKLLINGISVSYFVHNKSIKAVDNVFIELKKGESLGIAGESGCGKTTLVSAIMRNITPPGKITAGSIFLDGEEITKLSDKDFDSRIRWKKISLVFQGAMNSLDPVYTIKNQINDIFETHGQSYDKEKVITILKNVGLDKSVLGQYPHELSGGMKQRIVIALALLLQPDFIIADEPTTALDVLVQAQIIKLLKNLKENGISIILISHDLALISELVDKIGIMYAGKIVEFNLTKEIIFSPKNEYTKKLILSTPQLGQTFKKINQSK
ncbi:MAG TPA: ABC transporter ATP-binding protein [Nitrososphaeraceae archaeon]|nr:ABC transporter ATP-binding protein [Nitrososphaeraceae archaeon]